ncbi:type I glyceraldehyde-3-phosphate dehydrogenase [Candidatus Micrarchaeota archaeon]|nr:type I glyceraldehyde-3-phosphate dehydrogenase [Candidatus Micrarchaeota archaeon]
MNNIAINGFGRIGRCILKYLYVNDLLGSKVDVTAINLPDPEQYAYLFKHDSTYGPMDAKVKTDSKYFYLDDYKILLVNGREPENIPWGDLGVDIAIESTGVFKDRKGASRYLAGGAKKVLITAPAKDPDSTIVPGVNDKDYKKSHKIVSLASCTTNSVAPPLMILDEEFGITGGFLTTIHAYTSDQVLLDRAHTKDYRRARSAAINIIPTSTGAAKAVGLVLPKLTGKLDGMALRVPVPTGSLSDLTLNVKKKTTTEEVNKVLKTASKTRLKNIMSYSEDPIVSTDIIGDQNSSIIDSLCTRANGNIIKVCAWYDNEWGYSCRAGDFAIKM